jgi:hypothetical protein
VWVADRKGAECTQVLRPHDINHYFGEERTGEDCRYLNVWGFHQRRSRIRSCLSLCSSTAVLRAIGSSGMALYDGETVARHGAILVAMNYRVGALGFMAHPELTREQGGHSARAPALSCKPNTTTLLHTSLSSLTSTHTFRDSCLQPGSSDRWRLSHRTFRPFDAFNLFRRTRDWKDYDRELSGKMLESLVAVARTGSPSVAGLKWPAWFRRDERYLVLGDDGLRPAAPTHGGPAQLNQCMA